MNTSSRCLDKYELQDCCRLKCDGRMTLCKSCDLRSKVQESQSQSHYLYAYYSTPDCISSVGACITVNMLDADKDGRPATASPRSGDTPPTKKTKTMAVSNVSIFGASKFTVSNSAPSATGKRLRTAGKAKLSELPSLPLDVLYEVSGLSITCCVCCSITIYNLTRLDIRPSTSFGSFAFGTHYETFSTRFDESLCHFYMETGQEWSGWVSRLS